MRNRKKKDYDQMMLSNKYILTNAFVSPLFAYIGYRSYWPKLAIFCPYLGAFVGFKSVNYFNKQKS